MRIKPKYVGVFLLVLITTVLIIIIHRIYETNSYDRLKDKMTYQLAGDDDTKSLSIDFQYLSELNADIYSWIDIPNTNISYPVLQSSEDKDDDYYLKHNIDDSYGYPGVIYSQKRNSMDYTDPVTVLYGHNMKNKTMFAGLHQYANSDYFLENQDIYIYTKNNQLHYRIFASLSYDDRLILSYYDDFKDTNDVVDFYEESMKVADNKDYSLKVTSDSKLLVLSTCEKNDEKRYLVEAVLLED